MREDAVSVSVDAPRAFLIAIGASTLGAVFRADTHLGGTESFLRFLHAIWDLVRDVRSFEQLPEFDTLWFMRVAAMLWLLKLFLDDYYYFQDRESRGDVLEGFKALMGLFFTGINFYLLYGAVIAVSSFTCLLYLLGFFSVLLVWALASSCAEHSSGCKGFLGLIGYAIKAAMPFSDKVSWKNAYSEALMCRLHSKLIQAFFCVIYIFLFSFLYIADSTDNYSWMIFALFLVFIAIFIIDVVISGTFIFANRAQLASNPQVGAA